MSKAKSLQVEVTSEEVKFLLGGELVQSFMLKDVRLVAEYTTAKGAKPDHWYLKFIITEEETYELSMYKENIDDILDTIGSKLGAEILPKLGSSKDWHSIIHYPAELSGQPLWMIKTIKPVGLWANIKAMLVGKQLDFTPTAAALNIFSNTSR